jgi:hypothetical protein
VHDNHLGCITSWFELNGDTLGNMRLRVHAPGVYELMGWIDNFEFSEYPQKLSIGKPVANSIGSAHT